MKFFMKELQIWSHLLKKFLMENFIFYAVLSEVSVIYAVNFTE